MSLLKIIRDDAQYKKFQAIVEKARERLNLDADRTEALSLHASRTSRTLYGNKQYSVKSLIDASLKDLAFRSRLVEIRVKVSVQLSMLEEATKSIRRHISTEYSDDLSEFKTVDQRKSFVDRVLKVSIEYFAEGQALIDLIDTLVKDIDQASFHLRTMLESLKLLSDSKGGKVL